MALDASAPPRYGEVAKALAGRNGRKACERSLQVLGGIGFTTEHEHHHHHSRVLALDALLGTSAGLTRQLGAWLRTAGPTNASPRHSSFPTRDDRARNGDLPHQSHRVRTQSAPAIYIDVDVTGEGRHDNRRRSAAGPPARRSTRPPPRGRHVVVPAGVDGGPPSRAVPGTARSRTAPPHIGVLLDNTPDYIFWLVGAALSGAVVVGINSTYRGEQLAQLIEHTDCELLVTSTTAPLLDGADRRSRRDRSCRRRPAYRERLSRYPPSAPLDSRSSRTTSSCSCSPRDRPDCPRRSGAPRGAWPAPVPTWPRSPSYRERRRLLAVAVVPLQLAVHRVVVDPERRRSVRHPAQVLGLAHDGRRPPLRRHGAHLHRQGAQLHPRRARAADDADVPLRLAIGNEASEQDIKTFARRFDCTVRDSYGSTEGVIIIRRDPSMPSGSLGLAADTVKVLDPRRQECPRGVRRERPRRESRSRGRRDRRDPANVGLRGLLQERGRGTGAVPGRLVLVGDLAYRDEDGWFFFAGRSNEWLRVDGENFSAAPVEAIVGRHPDVRSVAVYAVPDDPVGDRVMAAVELHEGADWTPMLSTTSCRPARPRPEMGPGVRTGRRGASEAVEHEARQGTVAT